MAQFVDTKERSFTAGEAIEAYRVVKLSGDYTVSKTSPGDNAVAISREAVASGAAVAGILLNGQGTYKVTASGVIAQNAAIYLASDGKVNSTRSGRKLGYALEAATADGDIIEAFLYPLEDVADKVGSKEVFDDFLYFVDADLWTETADAGATGTTGVSDGAGGIMSVFCDGDDNDESYLHTTNELFKFEDDKPLFFEARVALTEANTDDANVIVGLCDAAGANTLLDNGAGPKASYSGAVFYKVDGGTVWQAEVSLAGTQTAVTLSTDTFPGDGTFQKLGIEFVPTAANTADVKFFIDGALVGTASSFSYSGATDMDVCLGVKAGGANEEELKIDYVLCSQVR